MRAGDWRSFGSFLEILKDPEGQVFFREGDRVCHPPYSCGQADPSLLPGLNSCDLKSIWYCSDIISLYSVDIYSLQWKEEGLPQDLKNICSNMVVSS